ncbi:MAG TPA: enolase C-terminal domain-like protein [Afifellaceae bacterium]|nr:enolase C-terminal domain-like protein [Afifellaceae bacterium]
MHGQPAHSKLTIRSVESRAVMAPMTFALGTSAAKVTAAPLLLIDLQTEEGIVGRAYLFCYVPAAAPAIARLLDAAVEAVQGERLAPADIWRTLARRFRLIGVEGIVRMAMAGLDIALWDALAKATNLPLAALLGVAPRPVPAYNSSGLGLMEVERLADEAEALLAGGFKAVKLRLGYPTLAADIAALRAVRKRVGEEVAIMVDYNQCLTVADALARGRALDAEGGVYWLEEPIRHDDYRGCARLAASLAVPVQIGENFNQVHQMQAALAAGACDYVMPDAERIGGVTGWQRAAGLAAAAGVEMSSHLAPELSVHLLAAAPTGHWLEYVDWANPLLSEPLVIRDGAALVPDRPGIGIEWDEAAVARLRIQ